MLMYTLKDTVKDLIKDTYNELKLLEVIILVLLVSGLLWYNIFALINGASNQPGETIEPVKVSNVHQSLDHKIYHLYQLPDGRKISVGYHNTNTYVSIPEDAQYVSHVAVWSEECLGVMPPSRGTLHLRVYPLNTTVFNEANSTALRFNFPMKNAKKWDEPILVYTDDLRKWLDDISANPTDN